MNQTTLDILARAGAAVQKAGPAAVRLFQDAQTAFLTRARGKLRFDLRVRYDLADAPTERDPPGLRFCGVMDPVKLTQGNLAAALGHHRAALLTRDQVAELDGATGEADGA